MDPFFVSEELLGEWFEEWQRTGGSWPQFAATKGARWGADQELEACCEWVTEATPWAAEKLRAARRPKPPSLKKQALEAHHRVLTLIPQSPEDLLRDLEAIRRALEALPDE